MTKILSSLKAASVTLRTMSNSDRAGLLEEIAFEILAQKSEILRANELDLSLSASLPAPLKERLKLSSSAVDALSASIRDIANLPDVVGVALKGWQARSGINITKISVPIGTIAVIYESRPAVTAEVAALCIKSANACALKGGKEARNTNLAIFNAIKSAFSSIGAGHFVEYLDIGRDEIAGLIKQSDYLDLIVPRGGEELVRYVSQNATVPVLKHDKGLCHIYIDEHADPQKALKIAINAKCSRPAVCNAAESILVHKNAVDAVLADLMDGLAGMGVEIFGCEKSLKFAAEHGAAVSAASEGNFATEYNDLKVNLRIVESFSEAVEHINRFGSGHSEAIISEDYGACERFLAAVDAACVYANASTRFSDGGEFGFGAEVGISTNKLHARGPVGLGELTTYKYIIRGHGEVR